MKEPKEIVAEGDRLDVRRWVSTPEGQAGLKEFLAIALPAVLPLANLLMERFEKNLPLVRQWAAQYAGPPAPGYEAFLVEQGCDVPLAKIMVKALTRFGPSFAEEWNGARKPLSTAFRKISYAAGKSPLVMSRRARRLEALLENGASHALVDATLAKAGVSLNMEEFRGLVSRAGNRDMQACEALGELSQTLLPHLPDPRGRRMSRETAIHMLFLEDRKEQGQPYGYTWSPAKEDFVDGATLAARISCGNPNFDPRAAYRLLRSGALDDYDGGPAAPQIETR